MVVFVKYSSIIVDVGINGWLVIEFIKLICVVIYKINWCVDVIKY